MIVAVATLAVALVVACSMIMIMCVRLHERDGRERAMLLHAVLARSPGEFGKLQHADRQTPRGLAAADQRWAEDLRAHLALIADGEADVPLVPEGL